jgi:hypothetical protein
MFILHFSLLLYDNLTAMMVILFDKYRVQTKYRISDMKFVNQQWKYPTASSNILEEPDCFGIDSGSYIVNLCMEIVQILSVSWLI